MSCESLTIGEWLNSNGFQDGEAVREFLKEWDEAFSDEEEINMIKQSIGFEGDDLDEDENYDEEGEKNEFMEQYIDRCYDFGTGSDEYKQTIINILDPVELK